MLTFEQLLTLKADRGFCVQNHLRNCQCATVSKFVLDNLIETCEALFKEKREYRETLEKIAHSEEYGRGISPFALRDVAKDALKIKEPEHA